MRSCSHFQPIKLYQGVITFDRYPAIFQRSAALIITKTDLLPYLNFDVAKARADMKRLAPEAEVFEVSATTGDGIPELAEWLLAQMNG